eukprot:Skav208379  [mRNA]  locus=scaffold3508:55243:62811:+ [translate_table: standard]
MICISLANSPRDGQDHLKRDRLLDATWLPHAGEDRECKAPRLEADEDVTASQVLLCEQGVIPWAPGWAAATWALAAEAVRVSDGSEQLEDRIPGDAPGFGKLGLPLPKKAEPEVNSRSLDAEINNGRLVTWAPRSTTAMVAITGMVAQNAFFGTTGPSMWLPGASAFEGTAAAAVARCPPSDDKPRGELGVQAPVGFWDPLGLSADGDVDTFKRRRAAELKHGRICTLEL